MGRPSITRQRLNDAHSVVSHPGSHDVIKVSFRATMTGLLFLALVASCSTPLENEEQPADILELEPGAAVVIGVGKTIQFRAVLKTRSGEVVTGYSISWRSEDESTASITGDGLLTAVAEGTTTIEAMASIKGNGKGRESAPGQIKKTATITVDPAQVASVEVSPGSATVTVGNGVHLSATVKDADGNTLENRYVNWGSTNASVAEVDPDGLVTALSAGTSSILATSEAVTGSASVIAEDTSTPPPPPPPADVLLAFPDAEGWGAQALAACRSLPLRVHFVTNLNDGGSGSLEAAIGDLSNSYFDVVVFRSGGTISGSTDLRANCVYLAGQTAPGGGILLRSGTMRLFNNQDVVIRYLRFRHGKTYEENGFTHCEGCVNLNIVDTGGARRIVVDHVSTSWAMDGNIQVWRTDNSAPDTRDITIQRSISADMWREHSTGMLIGGRDSEDAGRGVYNISVHHNLFANTGQRNPEVEVGDAENFPDRGIEIVNNVQYNWTGRPITSRKQSVVDIVDNYSKPGPATGIYVHRHMFYNDAWSEAKPDPSIYLAGNIMEGQSFPDQWSMIRDWYDLGSELPARMHRTTRLPLPPSRITDQPAVEAYTSVLADVGANKRLACDGGWTQAQDAVDARIINQVQTNSGPSVLYANVDEAGGWPAIAAGTPCSDADSDGLPDAWEERFFGCATCANPAAATSSGYLVIEHYLNGTNPQ